MSRLPAASPPLRLIRVYPPKETLVLSRRWLAIVGSATLAIAAMSAVTFPPVASAASCPWVGSTAPVPQRVAQVLAQMSQDQKISLLHGTGGAFVGNTPAIPSLCVPGMGLEDG